jgi:hypothetical protein
MLGPIAAESAPDRRLCVPVSRVSDKSPLQRVPDRFGNSRGVRKT